MVVGVPLEEPRHRVGFAKAAERYDWKGPKGGPRIEREIDYGRLNGFNALTVARAWMPAP